MKRVTALLLLLLFNLMCFSASPIQSVTEFVDHAVKQQHFNRSQLLNWLSPSRIDLSLIDRMQHTLKATSTDQYAQHVFSEERIQAAITFWHQHRGTFQMAYQRTGVPASVILSMLAIASYLDPHTDNHPVLNSLYTLSFHCPKQTAFFQKQLLHFLLMCRSRHLNPENIQSAYIATIGMPHLIPSTTHPTTATLQALKANHLLTSPDDLIINIADFLRDHGWQRHAPVAYPLAPSLNGPNIQSTPITREHLLRQGIATPRKLWTPPPVRVITLSGPHGQRYWLSYQNFDSLMAYHPSKVYALTVYQLALTINHRIIDEPQLPSTRPSARTAH